jgi:hypothetical protein
MKELTKCYCGHTTTCDCGPEQDFKDIELPQQERQETTLEEAAKKYANKIINGFQEQHIQENLEEYIENYNKLPNGVFKTYVGGYIDGAKWQQERSYSEEEVKDIVEQTIEKFYKHFYTLTKAEMKEQWFEQFKKK